MNETTVFGIWGACERRLNERGLSLLQTSDFDRVPEILAVLEKPYLTPMLSPGMHDFTEATCFWLFLYQGDTPVAGVSLKLEELGSDTVDTYWRRAARRQYGGGQEVLSDVAAPLVEMLKGRLVYYGDLIVANGQRGAIKMVEYFIRCAVILGGLKWDPDWHYAFLQSRHARAGAAARYGFTRNVPFAQTWIGSAPKTRSNEDVCIALPRREWRHVVATQVGSANEG